MTNFDEDPYLTDEERAAVDALREESAAKFEEIKSVIAQRLRLAPSSTEVEAEAEAACMRWHEDAQMRLPEQRQYITGSHPPGEVFEPLPAKMEFQRLLKDHYEIWERIADIRDLAIGRFYGDSDDDDDD